MSLFLYNIIIYLLKKSPYIPYAPSIAPTVLYLVITNILIMTHTKIHDAPILKPLAKIEGCIELIT